MASDPNKKTPRPATVIGRLLSPKHVTDYYLPYLGLIASFIAIAGFWQYLDEAPDRHRARLVDEAALRRDAEVDLSGLQKRRTGRAFRPNAPSDPCLTDLKAAPDCDGPFTDLSLPLNVLTGLQAVREGFRGLDLRGFRIVDAPLRGAEFRSTQLDRAIILKSDLSRARLLGGSLDRAVVEDTNLRGACMVEVGLQGTRFDRVILRDAVLSHVHLERTVFHRSDMRGMRITKGFHDGFVILLSDLRRADLTLQYGDRQAIDPRCPFEMDPDDRNYTELEIDVHEPDFWTRVQASLYRYEGRQVHVANYTAPPLLPVFIGFSDLRGASIDIRNRNPVVYFNVCTDGTSHVLPPVPKAAVDCTWLTNRSGNSKLKVLPAYRKLFRTGRDNTLTVSVAEIDGRRLELTFNRSGGGFPFGGRVFRPEPYAGEFRGPAYRDYFAKYSGPSFKPGWPFPASDEVAEALDPGSTSRPITQEAPDLDIPEGTARPGKRSSEP